MSTRPDKLTLIEPAGDPPRQVTLTRRDWCKVSPSTDPPAVMVCVDDVPSWFGVGGLAIASNLDGTEVDEELVDGEVTEVGDTKPIRAGRDEAVVFRL